MHDSCAYQLCGALDHLVPLQVLQVQGAHALDGDLANIMFLLFGDNDDHGGEDCDNDDDDENAADDDDDTAKCRTELKVSTCQARWPPFTDSPYFTCTNRKLLRGVFVFT